MLRRDFLKNAAFSAVAVSTTGFIRFDGNNYVGDCETTSDILGPFYRPGSPVRTSLLIPGAKGQLVELTGIIRQTDCVTPCKNAKVELWHCDAAGVYDNSSDQFRYRGTTYSDDKGRYAFQTIMPVPYDAGGGLIRPAHFHLMITMKGFPALITQLYFSGDKQISKDPWASSANAKKRILDVKSLNNGAKVVVYDISLAGQVSAEPASLDKLTGLYTAEKDQNKKISLFKDNGKLWVKNEVFGNMLEYTGENTFRYPDKSGVTKWVLHFEILNNGSVKMTESGGEDAPEKKTMVYFKG